jgi:hypothetical protein
LRKNQRDLGVSLRQIGINPRALGLSPAQVVSMTEAEIDSRKVAIKSAVAVALA